MVLAYCGWIKGNPFSLSLKHIHYAPPTRISLCILQRGPSARLVQFPGMRSGSREMSDTELWKAQPELSQEPISNRAEDPAVEEGLTQAGRWL